MPLQARSVFVYIGEAMRSKEWEKIPNYLLARNSVMWHVDGRDGNIINISWYGSANKTYCLGIYASSMTNCHVYRRTLFEGTQV